MDSPARACDPAGMLVELAVRDLALLERATLTFGTGLNVITGETGAGKSLLLTALQLLLGRRARADLVRRGSDRARVEGRFVLAMDGYGESVVAWLREHLPETLEEGLEEGAEGELELILTRTVGRDGRSRAHVNHRPVTSRILRELADRLVEIHGQNDQQKLFDPVEQIRLLDTYGGLVDQAEGYRERRSRWLAAAERLENLEEGEADRLQRLDLLRFQARELEEVAAAIEARDELGAERELLRHASDLARELGGTLDALSERDGAALDVLRNAERVLEAWGQRVEDLAPVAGVIREALVQAEEAAASIARFLDGVEPDPVRLEEVEGALGDLERLARKYRTDAEGLAERRKELLGELEGLEADSVDVEELEAELVRAREALAQAGVRLTEARLEARERLQAAVAERLGELGLEHATFGVGIETDTDAPPRRRFGPNGEGQVEFRLAANPGEEQGPLRQVASGGEAARILLALRGALAVEQATPTLIFDEVDAGVGGRLGPKVGACLAQLAGHHQILVVTHLPAIAALADRHLKVVKQVSGERTRTSVERLDGEPRVAEIADMIAGGGDEATALAEARRLLGE